MRGQIHSFIALLLINFGVNDWFNDRIQNIIKNSVYVAEGYLEEHKKTIKGDIYAMSSDLNNASNLYIRDKFNFEKLFFTQSLVSFIDMSKCGIPLGLLRTRSILPW